MEKSIKSSFGYTLKLVSDCKIKIREDSSSGHITALSDGHIDVFYNGEYINTCDSCSVCLGDSYEDLKILITLKLSGELVPQKV